ncbi:hypothetical protein SODALDRAFT_292432 [Sodiomyces alkalinus F11]|uniref:GRIP domain-containing protein n=1 Tax=Sodiomyces alkalinus (strain CBS 110278 / VKM F-3762 / F11) TaxID=1314773 RepID=A0A3N2Q4L4_SODAK|nr:hypothetical protein SODALDRAFT_292432 [Sodiomyces alkalinus F11]ROT41598.1 hypothetical protein SODALDRAFT_292432 [Sodiomyces alkalinus F11]
MFQRIKASIDRTIAEEQARQKPESPTLQRTSSSAGTSRTTSSSQTKRTRAQQPGSQDVATDAAPNPDPAVFEAAFVLDDSDEPSRAGTPKSVAMAEGKADGDSGSKASGDLEPAQQSGKDDQEKGISEKSTELQTKKTENSATSNSNNLPPEIRARLRKLEKLEATYPEILRSYRIAHSRATSIEPFERALKEHTSVGSIREPEALVEFLNSLKMKEQLVMEEYKNVSMERDEFKKKYEQAEKDLSALKDEVAALKVSQPNADAAADIDDKQEKTSKDSDETASGHVRSPSSSKSPVQSVLGIFSPKQKPQGGEGPAEPDASEDFFSFDNEIPQLQADVAAKAGQIENLNAEVESLKQELAVARESSAELVESLEKATRETSELRDTAALGSSLQPQLDAKDVEITALNERLEKAQAQLTETESSLKSALDNLSSLVKEWETKASGSAARADKEHAQAEKLIRAKFESDKRIDSLTQSIGELKKLKSEDEAKIAELLKEREAAATASTSSAPQPAAAEPAATTTTSTTSKKKQKKKKKGGAGGGPSAPDTASTASAQPGEPVAEDSQQTSSSEALEAEIAKLTEAVAEKDAQIERLSKRRKTEEDLTEEIETLRYEITDIGHDHVEAKDKIKTLEGEKAELKARIEELEKDIGTAATGAEAQATKLQSELDNLKEEYEEVKSKAASLQTDLAATQQLAQTRYKDLTDLREVLQKAQPEMKALRQDSAALESTKEELAAKNADLRSLEKRERDLMAELNKAQRLATDRETELKSVREKLAAETNTRLRLEDAQRVSGRDLRRSEAEKKEISLAKEEMARELQAVRDELNRLRPRVKELETKVEELRAEKRALQEETELRKQQYANAQGLLGSMRDQTAELTMQLKEARSQSESLEEELADIHKHLSERTREAERMRGLLAEVDQRADDKVREMRARMEAAIEERDRIEEESNTLARRKTRELEEQKQKLRDFEREVKSLAREKEELETQEREWRRRREVLEAIEEKAEAEVAEMRAATSDLRAALDASEEQVRDAEKQKTDLRKLLEESKQRYDKVSKDLKAVQAKLGASLSSERSSMDSSRSGLNGSTAPSSDTMYLKAILLQFLEQKDNKLREQLVPVLGRILRFDKNDEKKWREAVHKISVR